MNHSFYGSHLDKLICIVCKKDEAAHLDNAQCESCDRIEKCELITSNSRKILLCSFCQAREIEIQSHLVECKEYENQTDLLIPDVIEEELTSAVASKIARSIQSDLPANGSEFYNSKIIAIVELEKRINEDSTIENKPYFFAQQIQARQNILYKALVQTRELITEIDSERHANYRAINALASRLKREEREKLNIKYAEYIPSSKVGKIKQPRISAQDKVIEGIAKMMFAPRKDGIIQWEALESSERQTYIEKAKQYFKGNLK